MNFKTIVETLAANTTLSASRVVEVANLLATEDTPKVLRTHADLVALARTLPGVKDALDDGKKIVAIKVLREETRNLLVDSALLANPGGEVIGLKAAKDAIDEIAPKVVPVHAGAGSWCSLCQVRHY